MTDSPTTAADFSALPAAGLLRRLAALVYDSLLLLAISFAYTAIILLAQVHVFGAQQGQPLGGLALAGLWLCLSFFYSSCWHRSGQTLGMKTWRLRLQRPDGSNPGWVQCGVRCLLAPAALLAFGVGYLWCLVSPSSDCLHDIGSRTRVVVLPKALRRSESISDSH